MKGHIGCIAGTFGQHQLWNVRDHNTYMHPFIPGEILTDPLSLPKNLPATPDNPPPETKPKQPTSVHMRYSDHLDDKQKVTILHETYTHNFTT